MRGEADFAGEAVRGGGHDVGFTGLAGAGAPIDEAGIAGEGGGGFDDGAKWVGGAAGDVDGASGGAVEQRDKGGGGIGDMDEIARLGAVRCGDAAIGADGVDDIGEEAAGAFTGAVGEEDAGVGVACQVSSGEGGEEGGLGGAVERGGGERRGRFIEQRVRPIIFGAGAGGDEAIAAGCCKGAGKAQGGGEPIDVLRGVPEFAGLGVPGEVEEVAGGDSGEEAGGVVGEEIEAVDSAAGDGGAGDEVDFVAACKERGAGVAADEAGGASDEDARPAAKSA